MSLLVAAPTTADDERVETQGAAVRRFPVGTVGASIVLSIVLRARFLTTPLTSDEGGYLAVARAWASGKHLYTDAWVDRPQGLVVLFRAWDALTGGSGPAIRAMAILFGCVAVAAVAAIVHAVAGPRAAGAAAVLVAIASANAHIEGFIANGELLAGTVSALGIVAACAYLFRGRGRRWIYISGVLAGLAMSLKQSGFDGFATIVVCLVVAGLTHERTWRSVLRDLGLLVAGLVTVISVLLIHAAFVGFSAWWYAIAGYRLSGVNGTSGNWHRLAQSAEFAAPTIRPLAAAAAAGLVVWLVHSRKITSANVLIPAWLCFAVLGFLAGGLFHRHYWVMLTFPLAAATAIPLARLATKIDVRWLTVALACAVAFPSFMDTVHVAVLNRTDIATEAHGDPRLVIDERIGAWFREHAQPGDTMYAMCASAGLYAEARSDPPYRYLWQDGVLHARQSHELLIALFSGSNAPTYVAEYQHPLSCDASGGLGDLLRRRYEVTATVSGIVIHSLRDTPIEAASTALTPLRT